MRSRAPFSIRAHAKINLGLTVHGKRPDGYHEIETLMQQVSLADTLYFEPFPGGGFHFFCTEPALNTEDNLVFRAADLLGRRVAGPLPGVGITLYKQVPVEAGLAGGSSDAAATLLGLNLCWGLGLDSDELSAAALELGSDVPYCLRGGTALARGRGEKLVQLPDLPFFWVVIALPVGLKFSTAAVFSALDRFHWGRPLLGPLLAAVRKGSREGVREWLECDLCNTLETVELPGTDTLRLLKGRLRTRGLRPVLSGSGPSLFMLHDNYSLACSALRAVEEEGGRAFLCWTVGGVKEWSHV